MQPTSIGCDIQRCPPPSPCSLPPPPPASDHVVFHPILGIYANGVAAPPCRPPTHASYLVFSYMFLYSFGVQTTLVELIPSFQSTVAVLA